MNTIAKAIVVGAFIVMAVIAVAPVFGAKIPDSIWGIAVGTIASLVGTLVPAGKEKFVVEIPSNYRAVMEVKISESG